MKPSTRPRAVAPPVLTYRRFDDADVVELGMVQGCEVGLPPHFHDEDQVTFVNAGRRRFVLHGEIVVRTAGSGLVIPAGLVHRSFAETAGVDCLNLYIPSGTYALGDMFGMAERLWAETCRLDPPKLAATVESHRLTRASSSPDPDAARRASMSREAFSRVFKRRHGLPPRAFSRMSRLNEARALLRSGEAVAAVAAEVGFVDQSHFGRWFRRAFGVTPGQYRASWSQTYQTAR